MKKLRNGVLNLVINGLPSIHDRSRNSASLWFLVLNLIINGIPSILVIGTGTIISISVLNLVINRIPSIQNFQKMKTFLN